MSSPGPQASVRTDFLVTPEDRIIVIELGDCALVRTQGPIVTTFFALFPCL